MAKHKTIDPKSKAGQPINRSQSGVLVHRAAKLNYLRSLVENVGWKRLVVQYASGAEISIPAMTSFLRYYGKTRIETVPALGYTTKHHPRLLEHHIIVVDH